MQPKRVVVKARAGARTEKIEEIAPDIFRIKVRAIPEKGKANKRISELLAAHYGVPITNVVLESGTTSGEKRFTVRL